MKELYKRIDELLKEIKDLNMQNNIQREDLKIAKTKILDQKSEIGDYIKKIDELNFEVGELKKTIEGMNKKNDKLERTMKNELRRKDALNKKMLGSSKSAREYHLCEEIKKVSERYSIMSRFVLELADRLKFDFDIFENLVKISDGFEDPLIGTFLNNISIKFNEKENDISSNN